MQGVVDLESPADAVEPEEARRRPAAPPRRFYKGKAPYIFLVPYLLLTSVFFLYPFLRAVALAFYQTNGPRSKVFVGFDNFTFLLHDARFHSALGNTVSYTVCSIFLRLPLALALALLLDRRASKLKGRL